MKTRPFAARRALALAAVLVGVLAAGCRPPGPGQPGHPGHPGQPGQPGQPGGQLAGTSWALVPESLGVPVAGRPVTLQFEEDQANGQSTCNQYFAGVTVGPGPALRFGPIGSTRIGCQPPVAEAESAYFRALQAVTGYRLDGRELTLTGPGVSLRYTRQGGGTPSAGLVGDWVVTGYVDGRTQAFTELIEGTTITLSFNADGSAGGRACNAYGGSYTTRGDRLDIRDLFSTEMYCTEPEGVTEQEQEYFRALDSATRWQVEGTTLILWADADNARGRPVVKAEPAP